MCICVQALTDRCMAAEPADRPNVGTVQKQLVQLLANSQVAALLLHVLAGKTISCLLHDS